MRTRRRTWESEHTTRYRQWNHTRARSADKQQRTTNHITLPSRQVSSLISNDVFNIDAPVNGAIRLNKVKENIIHFYISIIIPIMDYIGSTCNIINIPLYAAQINNCCRIFILPFGTPLFLQRPLKPLFTRVSPREHVSLDVTFMNKWRAYIVRHSLVPKWRALIARRSLV